MKSTGQGKSLRDQLVGVWVPAAHETTHQDGSKRKHTEILVRPDLPKFRSNDRHQGTPDEHAAAIRGSVAHYGTWRVEEASKTLSYQAREVG